MDVRLLLLVPAVNFPLQADTNLCEEKKRHQFSVLGLSQMEVVG